MRVSYNWLKTYVDLDGITPEELAEKITRSGIEVDAVEKPGEGMKNLVVGYVVSCSQHPNADKLKVCLVDVGEEEPVQIVCGAPNVAAGQTVVVARPGARLPGGFKIKKSKIRGEVSNGMICSLEELGFEGKVIPKEFDDGIYVLPEAVAPGTDAIPLLNLDDAILDLDLTANRADCLSMIGVAYEVAAILGKNVKLPEVKQESSSEKASDYISVRVENTKECPLYTAKMIKNVKIAPSPLWMQMRLMASGIRPHNNVVDITNYILLEFGQPLHAFDYDRFGTKEVVVRLAKEGEKITTLDDVERALKEDHLVITNGKEPVALAGVMGGADSEVTSDTTNILLESAYFDGSSIRKTSKDHGLRSEASSRYEKGIDPNRVRLAAEKAASLMKELAGGEVLEGIVEADHLTAEPVVVPLELSNMNNRLGTSLTVQDTEEILTRLGFPYQVDGESFTVTIPSRRWDISIPEDLYEEVARIYGYDNIPKTLPEGAQTPGGLTPYQKKRRVVREVLEAAGLMQAVTYSLTSREKFAQFALSKTEPVELSNPMSEEHAVLRLSLLPHLLDAVAYNRARKMDSVGLFEIGSVFLSNGKEDLPTEREHVAGAMTGLYVNHPWQQERVKVDFYTVKGILEELFSRFGISPYIRYEKAEIEGLHPGQTAKILLKDQLVGFLGKIHPNTEKQYDVKNVFVFELNLETLVYVEKEALVYRPIPRFPAITRDIALVVDRDQSAGALEDTIRKAGGELLKDVRVFDVYEGDKVEEGKKSIAFTLTYYDPNRTLTDDEVNKLHEKIVASLNEKNGATLRQ